jgi:pyruvate kinase
MKNTTKELISKIRKLEHYALELESEYSEEIRKAHPNYQVSAKNLVHYIALRQHDIRNLQAQLTKRGLSSLGRAEGHVVYNLRLLLTALTKDLESSYPITRDAEISIDQANKSLMDNTEALFGPGSAGRDGRIMVTLPSAAAYDYTLVYNLINAGMNAARINCAHDAAPQWLNMVSNIKKARESIGAECKVIMDLAGPKIRTGKLTEGPKVLKWKALKNELGEIVKPASIWITSSGSPLPEHLNRQPDAVLYMPQEWIGQLRKGDKVRFADRRGKKRILRIVGAMSEGLLAETTKTAYIEQGIVMKRIHPKSKNAIAAEVTDLAPLEIPIILRERDKLVLTKDPLPGRPAVLDESGQVIQAASISCTHPQVFEDVKAGHSIFFDDGAIAGVVKSASNRGLIVEITSAKPNGSKLRADKGINFPDSELRLQGLTMQDLKDLDFIVEHADSVSMSFVNNSTDIELLLAELKKRHIKHIGVVVKIETRGGFMNMPWILLTAMQNYPIGVMIARGDLAIECGWVRLAELQEEIMWFCEAAHIPVIWATQVLEGLAKSGLPSRAEITDAAMAQRAECVMLNKGPYILKAIKTLDDILKRMQDHQAKKRSKLRKLSVSTQVH